MIIGLPKEVKNREYRVGLTPQNVSEYVAHGHTVLVQKSAGEGSGFMDEEYVENGAQLVETAAEAYDADMVVKVKEPIESEYDLLKEESVLYTYLHLAADEALTKVLLEKKVKSVAYETITDRNGGLPCLAPMSMIAGRLAAIEGAKYLQKTFGGSGVLISGVPGVARGKVTIVGGGNVGTNAAKMAVGLGADVTILDVNPYRLDYLDDLFEGNVTTMYSNAANISACVRESDLVIGAVLIPGRAAPKLVKEEDIRAMRPGSVVVDVAVDQGGCTETTHATTHEDPVFMTGDTVQYCVANMPGSVSRTATIALTNTTLAHGLAIADKGLEAAMLANPFLMPGLNTYDGKVTFDGVADAFEMEFVAPEDALA